MKICLLNIIEKVLKSGKNGIKPTSIYVYTDGVWEGVNDVKSVIQKSIGRLAEGKEDPSRIMFQFIQYGNDDQGTARLRELDDKCKEHHHGVEYDIVDTKRWDSDVAGIVIGSISQANDEDRDTASG
ncbi:hypothetical protein NW754_013113 [Fusarium falciforme]|nr:hypothetical protein NW754_013113 [Fusarium falciforme]